MDPLGATASCIAIVQILGTARTLFSTSRNALKNINSITSEVNSMKCILDSLKDQENMSEITVQTMTSCEEELNALRKKLEKINCSSDRRKRWKWILVKEDVTETLDSIRGMRENVLLAMTSPQSALLRDLQKQIVASNDSRQQHHLESSTRQVELLSLVKNTIIPQLLAPRGPLAASNLLQSESSRRPLLFTVRWTQKRIFEFVLFDVLLRTNRLRRCGRFTEDEKQLRHMSSVLLRFRPSILLKWLLKTVVFLEITWGETVGGLKINPRFYVQIPDSHQLIKAARTGDISLLRRLFNTNSASALYMTSAGWTPLHFAAAKGHLDICDFLISHGADLNAVGYIGMTPLHAAATFGQTEVMKLLITKGSDPNIFHDHGYHAIFQLFVPGNTLEGAEKLAIVDWVIRKQEHFEIDVHAVDVLHRDLSQVIIQTQTGTSIPGGIQHSTLVDALLTKSLRLDNRDIDGSTALHEASKCGRLNVVGQLLNGFAKPMIEDHQGRTPLHYAADSGHVAIVRRLLQENMAGIDDYDCLGRTPLSLAIERDHLDTVKLLIDLGAHYYSSVLHTAVRFSAKDSFDFLLTIGVKPDADALQLAISCKNLHYLRSCILEGVSPDSQPMWLPWPPLMEAVSLKRVPALQLLLSMGADVNLLSNDGDSALWIAVEDGSHDIVRILLKAGAVTHDLNRRGKMMNLIDMATKKGYTDIAEMLCKAGAPRQAAGHLCTHSSLDMLTAAGRKRVDISKELIRQGGNMNRMPGGWSSPFALACRQGSSEAAITLINAGLDLDSQTRFSVLPLFIAAAAYHIKVVEVLLQKGANINQLNLRGQTALLFMLKYVNVGDQTSYAQNTSMVKKLTLAGINVNVRDTKRETALGTACRKGLTSIVKILLKAGADISIPSLGYPTIPLFGFKFRKQYLPLDLAARHGHEHIVQLLLAKGANWRSLKHEKAIAISHSVLVKHWFADDDDGDEETTFLDCEPLENQPKVLSAQDIQGSNDDNHQRIPKQRKAHKAKKFRRYLIDSGHLVLTALQWIESCILHLCIGIASLIIVSLLLLHHKVPFSLLQENRSILRVLLWAIVLRFLLKSISA